MIDDRSHRFPRLCVALLVLAACWNGSGFAEDDERPVADAPAETEAAEQFLQDVVHEKTVQQQSDAVVAQSFFNSGKRAFEDLRYEDAARDLETATILDPDHDEARDLLARAKWHLGVRKDSIKVATQLLTQEQKVQIEASRVEMDHMFQRGVREFEAKDFESALKTFQSVEEKIRWNPYHIDMTGRLSAVQSYIARAETEVKNQQLQEQQKRRQDAMRRANEEVLRESKRKEKRYNALMRQAQTYLQDGFYEQALRLCDKILALWPEDGAAMDLREKAQAYQSRERYTRITDAGKEEVRWVMEMIEWSKIPYHRHIHYPDNWDEIVETRESFRVTQDAVDEEPWVKKIKNQMNRPVTFDFQDTPLEEVINFLQGLTNINIVLDPAATTAAGDDVERNVRLRVHDMPFESALRWLLRLTDLEYTFKNEAIFISTAEGIQDSSVLRIYDVRDLTANIVDYPGPNVSLLALDEEGESLFGGLDDTEQDVITSDSIVELIQGTIDTESWSTGNNSIDFRNGNLMVMQTPQNHKRIHRLLASLRQYQALQVNIQTRFLQVSESFLEDIGVDWRGLGDDGLQAAEMDAEVGAELQEANLDTIQHEFSDNNFTNGIFDQNSAGFLSPSGNKDLIKARSQAVIDGDVAGATLLNNGLNAVGGLTLQYALLGDIQLQAILKAVEKRRDATILNAANVTCFNRQRAHVLVADEVAYIQDVDVTTGTISVAADPTIGTYQAGTIMDVRPTVSSDRRYVTLELYPTMVRELVNIEDSSIQTEVGASTDIVTATIEFPILQITKARTTVMVPDNGTAVVGGLVIAEQNEVYSGIPFLAKIPFLNRLFSEKAMGYVKDQLMVLVTPKIIMFEEEEDMI